MDPATACTARVAPNSTASSTRATNSVAVVLVGVGRALALPEAAERAPHHADVRHVDVAVHDEGDGVAGQLGAQLVGGLAHVLDRLRRVVSAKSAVSSSSSSAAPWRARSIAPGQQLGDDRPLGATARSAPGDEAPVGGLDHVEHALLEPLAVHVLRVDAEALGQRVTVALAAPLRIRCTGRKRVLGRDVVAVGREPAEVGGALLHQRQPPVGRGWAGSGRPRPA